MKKTIVIVFGAALLAAGCGGGDGETAVAEAPGAAAPGASAPQTPDGTAESVPRALRFEGETLDGKPFDGASLAGKPVVFWFWAPWCPKCMGEGPDVAKAAAKYGDRVSFVGVGGLEKNKGRLAEFVSRTGTGGLTQLDDRTGELYAHFEVTSQSSFVFMAPDGTSSDASGPLGEPELSRHVDELLG
ncbi:redoxin domain-containing protein [Actinomadura algeriensis]|uniref:Peroxiredoxin n=1 Tax=Actinomadura algeriensis TaxID=1679523 RepID=A0ABR9JRT8_9ACTN|nr:redoxin domain-containing protein [Actinomadura algeriensis]MBE1533289.1 peroxiredoxin [Actinomadura algeriensis]